MDKKNYQPAQRQYMHSPIGPWSEYICYWVSWAAMGHYLVIVIMVIIIYSLSSFSCRLPYRLNNTTSEWHVMSHLYVLGSHTHTHIVNFSFDYKFTLGGIYHISIQYDYLLSVRDIHNYNFISTNGLMFIFVFYIPICLQFLLIHNHVWQHWFYEKQISRSPTQVSYITQINITIRHIIAPK